MSLILAVDDHEQNIKYLETILKREKHNFIFAYDGETGLKMAYDYLPDLILLDIMLPGMNGLEVCSKLSSDDKTADIPIILVTARVSAEDTSIGLKAGAHDYVKKPFDRVEILARIHAALKFREIRKQMIESERLNMFAATVVTANHKIKQPLTVIKLAISALKREIGKEELSKEAISKRIDYIETAVNEVAFILDQLKDIQEPKISDYVKDVKMVNLETSTKLTDSEG
jgi:DNA-binding response OmpR family regulator